MVKFDLPKEIVVGNGLSKVDYFGLAVLWNLYPVDEKPEIRKAERNKKENLTLKDKDVLKIIKEAVPGHNSFLLHLEIETNINEQIIDDMSLSLTEKTERLAKSIKKYVVVAA